MRVIVVGLGVQGHKRRRFAGAISLLRRSSRMPRRTSAMCATCRSTPSMPRCCASPTRQDRPARLSARARQACAGRKTAGGRQFGSTGAPRREREEAGVVLYTAYNHRFEPHYVRMRDLIASGALGRIYCCRMFYGNGTARLVRDSAWRDQGAGVLPISVRTCSTPAVSGSAISATISHRLSRSLRERSPDHVVIAATYGRRI